MLSRKPTGPSDRDLGLFGVSFDIEFDPIYEHPHDLLTILRRGGRRSPQCGDVLSEMQNQLTLVFIQHEWLHPLEVFIFSGNLFLFAERRFPVLFQCPGNESVLRFDGMELSCGSIGLLSSPLEPLPPLLVQAKAFLLQILGCCETEFQRSRFQNLKDTLSDEPVEVSPDDSLTQRSSQVL